MRSLARVLAFVYIHAVLLCLLWPLSRILSVLGSKTSFKSGKMATYFSNPEMDSVRHVVFGVACHSSWTWLTLIAMAPAKWLIRDTWGKLIRYRGEVRLPPQQTALLVAGSMMRNIRTAKKFADHMDARYIFALQPTLLYRRKGTKATAADVTIRKRREEVKMMEASYASFVERYYEVLVSGLSATSDLKDGFLDLTRVFEESDGQRFIDTVHVGDIGQKELAEHLAARIMEFEK